MNDKQMPGSTAWETTSPTRAFFFRKVKQPTMAELTASRIEPSNTYLMLGYLKLKNSINDSILTILYLEILLS